VEFKQARQNVTTIHYLILTYDVITFVSALAALSFLRPPKGSDSNMAYNIGGGTGFLTREPCTQQPS